MSAKLELDFIHHSSFAPSSWSWLGLSLFLTSLVLAVFTWQHYQTRQLAENEISSKLNQFSRQVNQKKLPVNIVSTEISPEKKQQIQTTVAALTIPWNELLLAVEKSDTQEIALLNLEPSSKKQQLILSGEAKNLQSVLDYIQNLEAQPMLDKVYLQKHHVDEVNAFKPVRFTLLAQWLMLEK